MLTLLCVHNNKLILAGLGDCGVCCSIGGRAEYSLPRHDLNNLLERQRILVQFPFLFDGRVWEELLIKTVFMACWR